MSAIAKCASFEGSDTFIIRSHETRTEWQGIGQTSSGHAREMHLLWTEHVIQFDCRDVPFRRGDKVEVGGVTLSVSGYSGRWIIAEGVESHFPESKTTPPAPLPPGQK